MTTDQIEQFADIGGLSAPDLNLKVLLRRKVCPEFMKDAGYTSWKRISVTVATVIGTQIYTLPTDLDMIELVGSPSAPGKSLQYIGEDPEKMATAELNGVNSSPTGYYLGFDASTGEQTKLKLNAPADAVYNLPVIYYRTTVFADDTTAVEMNKFIPLRYQWGLVYGLQMAICYFRFGVGDPRYVAASQSYGMVIERIGDNKENARRNMAVFAK